MCAPHDNKNPRCVCVCDFYHGSYRTVPTCVLVIGFLFSRSSISITMYAQTHTHTHNQRDRAIMNIFMSRIGSLEVDSVKGKHVAKNRVRFDRFNTHTQTHTHCHFKYVILRAAHNLVLSSCLTAC